MNFKLILFILIILYIFVKIFLLKNLNYVKGTEVYNLCKAENQVMKEHN